jgi:hypothetical protein
MTSGAHHHSCGAQRIGSQGQSLQGTFAALKLSKQSRQRIQQSWQQLLFFTCSLTSTTFLVVSSSPFYIFELLQIFSHFHAQQAHAPAAMAQHSTLWPILWPIWAGGHAPWILSHSRKAWLTTPIGMHTSNPSRLAATSVELWRKASNNHQMSHTSLKGARKPTPPCPKDPPVATKTFSAAALSVLINQLVARTSEFPPGCIFNQPTGGMDHLHLTIPHS